MITIAVAAILVIVGVPSFQRVILTNKLNTAASAYTNALNLARLDAIKLNATVQFCGTSNNGGDTLGDACGGHTGAVYSLPQAAAGATGTASVVLAAPTDIVDPIQISGDVSAVRFSGNGYGTESDGATPVNGTIAIICAPQSEIPSDNQRVVSMVTGTVVTATSSTGDCSP